IESIRMSGVLDTQKLWAKERGAIEQEVAQDFSDPEFVFYTRVMADMFKGTPYARTPLGTVKSFDRTTGPMLKKFYETWYAPNNAILVIVGNIQPNEVMAEVKKFFGLIPSKKLPPKPEFHLQPVKAETLHFKSDNSYGLVFISFRTPGYESPDYPAVRVLADVLNSQRGDLFSLSVEGKALFAGFSLDTLPKAGLGQALAAYPQGKNATPLIADVKRVLAEGLKKGFPPELVEAAKRNKITSTELQKNSIFGLSMAWSQALAVEGRESPDDIMRAIQNVSPEDVNRVARKYLDLDHSIVAVLTPEASGKPAASKSRGGMESFTPQKTKPEKLPPWAETALSRLSIPASSVKPDVTVLPNGIKLIVQPASVSDTVSVYGHIRNNPDLETPEGKEGVDQVLSSLFSFGTASLGRIEFQKALDEIGARESAGTDFSVEVLADRFERGVELLAENQLKPALPEKAFKIVREQLAASAAGVLESPDYHEQRALDSALFPPKDPTLRQPTPKTIASLTLQDVKDYYQKVFRPDLTVMVVIGKVTPQRAKEVISKYFGSWKAAGAKPETVLPGVPPNKKASTVVPDASRVQDSVTLAQTLQLTRSDPDYYALEVGNHVLGGAFYATRFYRDLRENEGLVYYVSTKIQAGLKRSVYTVEYACDPSKAARARSIVEANLREMQQTPVSPQELHQAKALLLREIPLAESSVESIAMGLIYRATHDLPLDEPIRAAHRYMN
ncbi:MAG TPA: pitrilysin family protein, partial [Thermodesulfobacteriota bacterium]|nr:pitrilysin family protein [Thermodesulfobacteriota bacterium]